MNSLKHLLKRLLMSFYILICTLILYIPARAQEHPPKPVRVEVSTLQHLSFGIFIQNGNYGTVTVSPNGVRSSTGSIILPAMSSVVTPALFNVRAIPGTIITIAPIPDATLTTSFGVTPLTLHFDSFSYQSPFITTGINTEVKIGGTIIVNALTANPAGAYSGTFNVTFIQE